MPSFSKLCFLTACAVAIAAGSATASNVAGDQPARNLRADADHAPKDAAPPRALQGSDWDQFGQGGGDGGFFQGGGGGGGMNGGMNGGGGGGGVGRDGKSFSFSFGDQHSNSHND